MLKFRRKLWATFLALALICGMIPAVSAAEGVIIDKSGPQAKITYQGGDKADLGDIIVQDGPYDYYTDPIDFSGCYDTANGVTIATGGITKTEFKNSKITVKTVIKKGEEAIEAVEIVYDSINGKNPDGYALIKILFRGLLWSNDPDGVDFELDVNLVVDGKLWTDSTLTLSGNLRNDMTTYSGGDNGYVYMGDGIITESDGDYKKVEMDLGDDVSVFGNMFKGQRYWAMVRRGVYSDEEDAFIKRYGFTKTYYLGYVGVDAVADYVELFGEDLSVYVYDRDLCYIGTGGDKLPLREAYYLSPTLLPAYRLTPPAPQTVNGVTFNITRFSGIELEGGFVSLPEGTDVVPCFEMTGSAAAAGTYRVALSSVKADYNAVITTEFTPSGAIDDWCYMDHYNYDGRLIMPAQDVDDFVFSVTFIPSGGSGGSSSSSSGGGSSGGGGGGNTPSTSNTPTPVNNASTVGATNQAVAEAKKSGSDTTAVTLKNVSDISLNNMKAITNAAKDIAVKLNADSMNGSNVDVRITIDPAKAVKGINLSASTTSQAAKSTAATFKKHFDNNVSVVSLSQQGDFGMPVEIAAKVDKNLNTETLVFYSYDKATNSFKPIADAQYWIDKNGYVHFTTTLAGDIIITDKPLAKK